MLAGGTNGIAGIASTWGGGFVRIVGSGKIVNGVPAVLKGQITGYFIDTRPGRFEGDNGVVGTDKVQNLERSIASSTSELRRSESP